MENLDSQKKTIIDYSRWLARGNEFLGIFYEPMLLNEDGFRCCLGFICQSEGVEDSEMLMVEAPDLLEEPRIIDGLTYQDSIAIVATDLTNDAMNINDSLDMPITEKIEQLIARFDISEDHRELFFINVPDHVVKQLDPNILHRINN